MGHNFSITQNIPVANHVYKFLVARCGTDSIEANRNGWIGSLVLSLHSRNTDILKRSTNYNKIFKVTISESYYQKLGMHISIENAQLFNDMVDKIFRDELYCHAILNRMDNKSLYLEAIRKFLEAYNITEDDIKLDTLYRDFKRKKEEINKNLNQIAS